MEDSSSDIDRRAHARVGTTIGGRWRLSSLLGVGGMAAVYAAERVGGDGPKVAAVKMLHPELSADGLIRKRFVREGYVANAIEHPGAVKVFDKAVADDGSLYLEMELLEGMTLEKRCEAVGRLPAAEVVDLAHQLLGVLAVAHRSSILHRDIKPENLFLTTDGELKILDFGIARMRQGDGSGTTQTGDVMGTPLFMAPEQARGRWDEVDARSDLWGVGAVAFTLLAGRPVHLTKTSTEALVMVVTEPVTPLALLVEGLPKSLTDWVDKALAFDKEARFADADAMRRALEVVSEAILGRPPATRIVFGAGHPMSERSPRRSSLHEVREAPEHSGPTMVSAAPDAAMPTLVAPSRGRSRHSAPDAPPTSYESLDIPKRRSPLPIIGVGALIVGGGLAVLLSTPKPVATEPEAASAPDAAPLPKADAALVPEPSARPAASASAAEPNRPAPAASPSIAPAPAAPVMPPLRRSVVPKVQPPVLPTTPKSADDPYDRRH